MTIPLLELLENSAKWQQRRIERDFTRQDKVRPDWLLVFRELAFLPPKNVLHSHFLPPSFVFSSCKLGHFVSPVTNPILYNHKTFPDGKKKILDQKKKGENQSQTRCWNHHHHYHHHLKQIIVLIIKQNALIPLHNDFSILGFMALIWALLFILLCKSRNCHRHELCSSSPSPHKRVFIYLPKTLFR